jgi:hypothetical protein
MKNVRSERQGNAEHRRGAVAGVQGHLPHALIKPFEHTLPCGVLKSHE